MKRYETAAAFRRALEDRLLRRAKETGVALQRLRTRIAMERFLARLFSGEDPWLLKGGYALELLLHPRARTTRDIDLNLAGEGEPVVWDRLRDRLQEVSGADLEDGFVFRVGQLRKELQGAPMGGARFPIEARVAGREFCRFHLDVGVGDPVSGVPEERQGPDFLDFAGIEPARVRIVALEQILAEKVHAYSKPWGDRENTRVRDLVDLLLVADLSLPPMDRIRVAIQTTFAARGGMPVPDELPPPPESWNLEFEALARDLQLRESTLSSAFARLSELWRAVQRG